MNFYFESILNFSFLFFLSFSRFDPMKSQSFNITSIIISIIIMLKERFYSDFFVALQSLFLHDESYVCCMIFEQSRNIKGKVSKTRANTGRSLTKLVDQQTLCFQTVTNFSIRLFSPPSVFKHEPWS